MLARGYAVLRDDKGQPITGVAALQPGHMVEAELKDGRRELVVAGSKASPKKRKTPSSTAPQQGSLL